MLTAAISISPLQSKFVEGLENYKTFLVISKFRQSRTEKLFAGQVGKRRKLSPLRI